MAPVEHYAESLTPTTTTDHRPSIQESNAPLVGDGESSYRNGSINGSFNGSMASSGPKRPKLVYQRDCPKISPPFILGGGFKNKDRAWAFSPSAQYLALDGGDGNLLLWDLLEKQHLPLQPFYVLAAENGNGKSKLNDWAVTCIGFDTTSPRLAAGHANGHYTVWDFDGKIQIQTVTPILMDAKDSLTWIGFTDAWVPNTLLIFQRRRLARMLDLDDLTNIEWIGATDSVSMRCKKQISVSQSGHVLACQRWYGNPDIVVVNMKSTGVIAQIPLEEHTKASKVVAKLHERRLLPQVLRQPLEDDKYVAKMAPYAPSQLAHDARSIAFVNTAIPNKHVALYDFRTKREAWRFETYDGEYANLAFSRNDKYLAATRTTSESNDVRVWDCATGNSQVLAITGSPEIKGLVFAENGRLLGLGSAKDDTEGKAEIYELANAEIIDEVAENHIAQNRFSVDGFRVTRQNILPGLTVSLVGN